MATKKQGSKEVSSMENNQTPQGANYDQKMQRMQKQIYIVLIVLLLTAIALCLFVLSPWAKYAFAGDGADSSRVAKFVVNVPFDDEEKSLAIDSSDSATFTQKYEFTVSNKDADSASAINEVATSYDVIVTFPSEFIQGDENPVAMTIVNGEGTSATTITGTASEDKKTYTFSNVGSFEANVAKTDTLNLTFSLPEDKADSAVEGEWKGIKISALATQVD